jgi:hypothetical protein
MFCFEPLLAIEIMIPRPARITTPITIQLVSMFCRIPSYHNAARTPPMSKTNPKKYRPAHFIGAPPDPVRGAARSVPLKGYR